MGETKGKAWLYMVVVVDANILIQCIINIKGKTAALILQNFSSIDFVVPEFIISEIKKKEQKVYTSSRKKDIPFQTNLELLLTGILIVKDEEIPEIIFKKAYELVKNVDADDVIYVSLTIALEALLWTDDLKLQRGLKRKGFNDVINTKEFREIVKGLA